MTITFSLIVLAIIGALIYALSANPKAAELGRLVFGCSLLAICMGQSAHVVAWFR